MIIITTLDRTQHSFMAGNKFQLIVTAHGKNVAVIEEEITEAGTVDFCASFRFATEDGCCVGNHFCGIFAKQDELPDEIKNAKQVKDLTPEQRENFFNSINVAI